MSKPNSIQNNPTWIHNFGDFKLVLDNTDNDLSRQVKYTGTYSDEQLETQIIKKMIKKNMTVLDLGANLGFYSMLSASIVGEHGRVFAFEPFLDNVNLIQSSKDVNSFNHVTVVNAAVSDHNGTANFFLSPFYSSEHSLFDYHYSTGPKSTLDTINVDIITVDYYFDKFVGDYNVDFIKMDIEGSEGRAINGMKKLLQKNDNITLLTEFWPNALQQSGISPKEYLLNLNDLGFELNHIDGLEQQIYSVTVNEVLDIMNERTNGSFESYKQISLGNWYTTLLCIK